MSYRASNAAFGKRFHATLRKYLCTYPEWNFSLPRVRAARSVENIGSNYAGYWLDVSQLRADSIVYSLGVGEDISFDLALIERVGAHIHAFDPTPRVQAWLGKQRLPPEFHFHAIGIAEREGEQAFHLPPRREWISHSVISSSQFSRESVVLPVTRLCTAMRKLGHKRLDLLKMDIEGAEYSVIEEIAAEKMAIAQLLVEFHHRLMPDGIARTRKAIRLLDALGLQIASVCPRGEIFTFVQGG